ncbi:MAG: hypothetical protein M5R42_12535 [Rhodocyclaceae bacterium]|nr:hypothetical protein [Rhodocyclaceae bacterium]
MRVRARPVLGADIVRLLDTPLAPARRRQHHAGRADPLRDPGRQGHHQALQPAPGDCGRGRSRPRGERRRRRQ